MKTGSCSCAVTTHLSPTAWKYSNCWSSFHSSSPLLPFFAFPHLLFFFPPLCFHRADSLALPSSIIAFVRLMDTIMCCFKIKLVCRGCSAYLSLDFSSYSERINLTFLWLLRGCVGLRRLPGKTVLHCGLLLLSNLQGAVSNSLCFSWNILLVNMKWCVWYQTGWETIDCISKWFWK